MRMSFLKSVTVAVALGASTLAFALPSVADVEQAVRRGDYASAERMTREVVAARPNSAKAHYVYAELLAHDGEREQARREAETARSLDPAITFTSPERFRAFEARLDARPRLRSAAPVAAPAASGWLGPALLLIGLVALVGWLVARARRAMPGRYGPMGVATPMGGGGYGYGPAAAPPPAGGGLGTGIAAGLGGLAAGMLVERLLDGHHDRVEYVQPVIDSPPAQGGFDDPIDFGNGGDWGGDSGGDAGGGGSDW